MIKWIGLIFMFGKDPQCMMCGKDIKGNDMVYIKMRYPERRGMTEIKAYLKNEGRFICEACFDKKSN